MKVLIAVDSFKGSLNSRECADIIALGIKDVYQNAVIKKVPVADGGEGTVETLINALGGEVIEKEVNGPLQENITAQYGILSDHTTAVIEVAAACGLPLLKEEDKNPLSTSTYGVGQLIYDALERGCTNFIIGLGGTATNDGGMGMLTALGVQFLDEDGNKLPGEGRFLNDISTIDTTKIHPKLTNCSFKVACDVSNPLFGEKGAAYIFAPQKGADSKTVKVLDEGLKNLADVIVKEYQIDVQSIAGSGAAGGLGAAFSVFLHGDLQPGATIILDLIQLRDEMPTIDFIVTGEGKLDSQTAMGKAPLGIAQLAKEFDIPVIGIAGSVNDDESTLNDLGITSYFSIIHEPISLKEAMKKETTEKNIRLTSSQIFRLIKSVRKK